MVELVDTCGSAGERARIRELARVSFCPEHEHLAAKNASSIFTKSAVGKRLARSTPPVSTANPASLFSRIGARLEASIRFRPEALTMGS